MLALTTDLCFLPLSPQYYNDFGDIIKETMYRTRQTDKIESARTLVLCLQQVWSLRTHPKRKLRPRSGVGELSDADALFLCSAQLFIRLKREQESGGRAHPGVQTFTSIKELARRFALTFGDLVKFRECVVMIHRSARALSSLPGFVFLLFFFVAPEVCVHVLMYAGTASSLCSRSLVRPQTHLRHCTSPT